VTLRLGAIAALVAGALAAPGAATTPGADGRIVFAQEVGGHYQLFTIRADGSGKTQITRAGGRVDALNPDWSPDGKRIVFELDRAKGAVIAVSAADGSGLRVLTPRGFQGQPSFAPDGRSIVYERDLTPSDNGLWLMRGDGSAPRRITRSPRCCDTDPNFSPDGKVITFVRIKQDGKQQALFAVRPDGSGLKQLTPYAWEVAIKHDWSPDGKLIVLTTNADFVHPSESANLVTIRPDGTGRKQLTSFTRQERNAFAGSFSPDGKLIVFRLEQGDSYALAVVGRNGGKPRLLMPLGKDKPRFVDWGSHP
jgi:Tol biopolymer transport system component